MFITYFRKYLEYDFAIQNNDNVIQCTLPINTYLKFIKIILF